LVGKRQTTLKDDVRKHGHIQLTNLIYALASNKVIISHGGALTTWCKQLDFPVET